MNTFRNTGSRPSARRRRPRLRHRFSKWLRVQLETSGLDQSGLARRAGVSAAHISMILKNKRQPSGRMVRTLAAALGVQDLSQAMVAAGRSESESLHLVRDPAERGRAIADIGSLVSSAEKVDEILPFILARVRQLIAFDYGTIAWVDWEIPEIRVLAHAVGDSIRYGRSAKTEKPWSLSQGYTGLAATTGQPVLVDDVRADPDRYLRHNDDTISELVTPLKFGSKVIAVLNLESNQRAHFTLTDQQTTEMLAPTIAAVLERCVERQERDELETQAAALSQLHCGVIQKTDERAFLQELATRVTGVFREVDLCVVRVLDPEWKSLLLRGIGHRPEINPNLEEVGYHLPLLDSVSGRAVRFGTQVRRDVAQASDFHQKALASSLHLLGMVAVRIPAIDATHPLGSITVYTTRDDNPLHDTHVRTLERIAQFAAIAVPNLRAARRNSAIVDATRVCRGGPDNESTHDRIAQTVCETIAAKAASVFLWNGAQFELKGTTAEFARPRDKPYDPWEGKTGYVGATGRAMRIVIRESEDIKTLYPHCREMHKWSELDPRDGGKLSFMCVPIVSRGSGVLGVIRAVGRSDRLPFGPADQEMLSAIADQLAGALDDDKRPVRAPTPVVE